MSKLGALLVCLVCLFFMGTVSARWAIEEDVDTIIEFYNRDIEINQDGTYTETIEISMVPTKESAKDNLVSFPLVYNASNAKLTILEAKTIKNGQEFVVDKQSIEDKPLASSPSGFDQTNQVLIAFSQVDINSKVYLKYRTVVNEPVLPGFFSTEFIYGSNGFWKNSTVHIISKLPLNLAINDPEEYLDIKELKKETEHEITIVLKRPVIKIPTGEKYIATNNKIYPWVTVSSFKEWSQFGNKIVEPYENVLSQPLPPSFRIIVNLIPNKVGKSSNTIDKLNAVTSLLAESITYMGDWRTIKGKIIPRNLNEIETSRIGDCKDLSAATAAILRELGMKANIVLIYRGINNEHSPNNLPYAGAFNHAIVRVTEGNKYYWVDPTNFTSFAQGIYPDIANRDALVLIPENSGIFRTEKLDPQQSESAIIEKIELPKQLSDPSRVTGKLLLKGVDALGLTGADLRASKEVINHYILSTITNPALAIQWDIRPYTLNSRIVRDLDFSFQYTEERTQLKSTMGRAFLISTPEQIRIILTKTKDRVSDLAVTLPSIYRYETTLPRASLMGRDFVDCSINSPWISGVRKIINKAQGIEISDELIVKKYKINIEELRSAEYEHFQNEAFKCFGDTVLIYK